MKILLKLLQKFYGRFILYLMLGEDNMIRKIDLKLGEYADKLVNLMNNHTIIPVLIMTGLYVLANILAGGNILR